MPLTGNLLKTLNIVRDDNKPQREYDTEGLYRDYPKGVKKWQMKYKRPMTGKENRLSFGIYPEVSLKNTSKRDDARKLLKIISTKRSQKRRKAFIYLQEANTFGAYRYRVVKQTITF